MPRLVREIRSTLAEVADAASAAEALCERAGADEEQALRIGLALDELAANALVHGAVNEIAPKVTVEVWDEPESLHLRVRATGPRFDPRMHTPMDESFSLGGRGLAMVFSFADELSYARADGQNVTTFSVAKKGPADG